MPRGSKYFDDIKHNFLIKQSNKNEWNPNKLELKARMLDERIIQAQDIMKDEDFINSEEFKSFLFNIKQNKLTL